MGRYGEDVEEDDADEDVERGAANGDRDRIGTAIVGGHLYESDAVEDLEGAYVFGDWSWNGEGPGRIFLSRPPEGWPDGPVEDEPDDEAVEDDEDEDDDDDDVFEPVDPGGDEEEADDDADDEDETDVEADDDVPAPDEVDRWPIEELALESEDEVADDGALNHLVYGFGRDADGEVYVLTSDTPTVEGEGFVSRIVPADDDLEDEPDEEVDDEDEADDDFEPVDPDGDDED